MKKALVIIRKGFDSDYIISHLPVDKYEFYIIEESGKTARKKKLKRMFNRKRNLILTILDLIALLIYDKIETWKMKKICYRDGIDNSVNSNIHSVALIDDINDSEARRLIDTVYPDVMVIYGTGIVKKAMIDEISADIYNVHSSVLPAYRNVHSDFWAYYNRDYDKIGLSLFKLSSGVDTGDIAVQMVNDLPCGSKLYEYKAWNLVHVPIIIETFLDRYFANNIEHKPQDENCSSRFDTPNIEDIMKIIIS